MKSSKLIVLMYFCVIANWCYGQSNGNCDTAIEIDYEDIISYQFDDMDSDRGIGDCWGAPIKKHWFSLEGNGQIIKLRYSISYESDPALLIVSGSCESLNCIEGGYNGGRLYFQTEAGVDYKFIFTGKKVYGNPDDEPAGQFDLVAKGFEPNCLDSLVHVTAVDRDTTLAAIDYINACPELTNSVKFISGSSILLEKGFEVSDSSTLECIIYNCATGN